MTTAHRPTWNPAQGGEEQGTFRLHAPSLRESGKDAPAHKLLKLRKGSGKSRQSPADLRKALERKEKVAKRKKIGAQGLVTGELPEELKSIPGAELDGDVELNSEDDTDDSGSQRQRKKVKLEKDTKGVLSSGIQPQKDSKRHPEDGSKIDSSDQSRSVDDSDSESSGDDEDDELMAELEKIRREREEERLKKEQEQIDEEAKQRTQAIMRSNPLLNLEGQEWSPAEDTTKSHAAFGVKQRWGDDTVFRNQTSGEKKLTQRFVNDTLRNDFHRRFLRRYIR